MIAVCPLTTAGAPSDEAKESAIVHAPRPTTPMPANNFNPLLIMICAPQCRLPNLHCRLPAVGGRASAWDTRTAHAEQTTLGFVVVAERDFEIPFKINCCNALLVLRLGWPAPRSHCKFQSAAKQAAGRQDVAQHLRGNFSRPCPALAQLRCKHLPPERAHRK